ncbi:apolipo protein O-domain-containing protein [Xylariomycetidae sp. FL0641]|nr:apolipo protein O-domain-containing protein [Xylariomycetidae sp. FL0641]
MAARVLLRRRVAAPFMAATLAGVALFPATALAEAPPADQHHYSKKPIYDDYEAPLPKAHTPVPSPASETIPRTSEPPQQSSPVSTAVAEKAQQQQQQQHGPTPTDRLAVQIGRARLFLHRYAAAAEDAVNGAVDRAFDLEQSFTATVASLAPPRESGEQVMPGLVYVLVAGMAGSIVARNRGLVLRAAAPLALGVGAGWLVLPLTMRNVSDLLWTYEQRFPAVADGHLRTREALRQAFHTAKAHADISKSYVDEKVGGARDIMEDWVKKGK